MLKDNPQSKSSKKKTRSQNTPLTGLLWVSHIRHIFQVSPFRPQWDPLAFYLCSTESPLSLRLGCSPSASGGAKMDHKFQRWKTVSINYPDDWCLAAFCYVASHWCDVFGLTTWNVWLPLVTDMLGWWTMSTTPASYHQVMLASEFWCFGLFFWWQYPAMFGTLMTTPHDDSCEHDKKKKIVLY